MNIECVYHSVIETQGLDSNFPLVALPSPLAKDEEFHVEGYVIEGPRMYSIRHSSHRIFLQNFVMVPLTHPNAILHPSSEEKN